MEGVGLIDNDSRFARVKIQKTELSVEGVLQQRLWMFGSIFNRESTEFAS